ncbi:MAG: hypothetical protein WDW36_000882 [Sanguina aurantia]
MDKFDKFKGQLQDIVRDLKPPGLKFMKELKEFDNLIKAIGECKSKAEEDRIIVAELEVLKVRLSDPKLDKSRGREYMVRLIYCEMLGHDASFAYIKAVQFASETNIQTKKAAYLALTQFLDHKSELVLLLVNTLLSDLKSDNYLVVCTALVVTTKLIGPDLINAVYPMVVERLRHPKEHVRKKAVMALHRFSQLDPSREGALAGVDIDRYLRTMLCDKDPSVMSAAVCALHEVIKRDPRPYKNLIPSFTSILKQVSEHRLPKSYDYHRFPAPFIQIKLLKVLAALGVGDKASSENMYAVVQQTLRRANTTHTIGHALIYECVNTITSIYPNPALLAAAAESISGFLKSSSHNLRYVGIDALTGIVKINPAAAVEHQLVVIDCLEDSDDSLKLKTLELLYRMTKSNNVEVIVERMMTYLRTATDEHVRRDIVRKVSDLAERYAPTPTWFITVVSEVFELGGEHVEAALGHNLCRLVAEQDAELHCSAVGVYLRLLERRTLPSSLLMVIVWVLGEYGHLVAATPGSGIGSGSSSCSSIAQLMDRLVAALETHRASDLIKGYTLTALAKLLAHTASGSGSRLTAAVAGLAKQACSSSDVELQQRGHELLALASALPAIQLAALPLDASCEELDESELRLIASGGFLDWFVSDALASGAAPYLSEQQRSAEGNSVSTGAGAGGRGTAQGNLRFEAYETGVAPVSSSSMARVAGSAGSQNPQSRVASPAPGFSVASPATAAAAGSSSYCGSSSETALKGAAARKWGPAQFAKESPPVSRQPSPAPSSAANHQNTPDLLSAPSHTQQQQQGKAQPPSERDRFAASLFGPTGSSSRPAIPPAPSQSRQQTLAPSATSATVTATFDLLGGSPPPRACTTAAAVADQQQQQQLPLEIRLHPWPPQQQRQRLLLV